VVPGSDATPLFLYTTESQRYKVMKPNYRTIAYGVPLQTNELGFRDKHQKVPPKTADEFRIIVLGDSFTVSAGVPYEDLYTTTLQRELEGAVPDRKTRVMNLACAGHNLLQYSYVLQEVGLSLGPDLVVVSICVPNDFQMASYWDARRLAMSSGQEDPSLYERLYLPRVFEGYFTRVTEKVKMAAGLDRDTRKRFGDARLAQEEWDRNAAALVDIQRAAAAKGIPLLTVLFPAPYTFSKQQQDHSRVAKLCEQHGISSLDMLPHFSRDGRSARSFRLNIIDGHPNVQYHRLVSARVASTLRDQLQNHKTRTGLQTAERAYRQ